MGLAGAYNVVIRFILLEHEPHGFDIVSGIAPIPFGVQVAHSELIVQAQFDAGYAMGHLTGGELQASPWRFVVEKDS